jgi:uncharacterized Fe-S radical SAM superfamily protein PflX
VLTQRGQINAIRPPELRGLSECVFCLNRCRHCGENREACNGELESFHKYHLQKGFIVFWEETETTPPMTTNLFLLAVAFQSEYLSNSIEISNQWPETLDTLSKHAAHSCYLGF